MRTPEEKTMTQRLSKMNTNQLRERAVALGADKKRLYGTSRTALIVKIHELEKTQEAESEAKHG